MPRHMQTASPSSYGCWLKWALALNFRALGLIFEQMTFA